MGRSVLGRSGCWAELWASVLVELALEKEVNDLAHGRPNRLSVTPLKQGLLFFVEI